MSEHLSIGEVLSELRDDYPDITISKIRFLESQGLIDPERTPSGYRKFYPDDVTRLRWILNQQKEHFLPLKVIRERLEESGGEVPEANARSRRSRPSKPAKASPTKTKKSKTAKAKSAIARRSSSDVTDMPMLPLDDGADDEPMRRRAPKKGGGLTREELASAAGVDDRQLVELESYGLLAPIAPDVAGEPVLFDEDALVVARTAGAFAKHGIEARHLKMYKNFAEREAGMLAQVLLGYLRQRNPEARERAQAELEELASLGRSMRAAMLRRAVPRSLSG